MYGQALRNMLLDLSLLCQKLLCLHWTIQSLEKCSYCGEDHYSSTGSAQHIFEYIPLAPRFLGFFSNPRLVEKLSYQAEYKYDSDTIGNVFNLPESTKTRGYD